MKGAPELITRAELAEALRVNPRTVQRWEMEGAIPVKIDRGPVKRYVLADVLAALEVPEPVKPAARVLPSDLMAAHRAGRKGGRR
jgi:predicted site-specific integrase-resolvase